MKYLFSKATRARMPLSAAFEISPECNMNCKMCYVKMTPKEMEKVGRKRNPRKKAGSSPICGVIGTVPFQVLMVLSTLLSAIGALIPLS